MLRRETYFQRGSELVSRLEVDDQRKANLATGGSHFESAFSLDKSSGHYPRQLIAQPATQSAVQSNARKGGGALFEEVWRRFQPAGDCFRGPTDGESKDRVEFVVEEEEPLGQPVAVPQSQSAPVPRSMMQCSLGAIFVCLELCDECLNLLCGLLHGSGVIDDPISLVSFFIERPL